MIDGMVQLLGTPSFVIAMALGLIGYVMIGLGILWGIYIVVRVARSAWAGPLIVLVGMVLLAGCASTKPRATWEPAPTDADYYSCLRDARYSRVIDDTSYRRTDATLFRACMGAKGYTRVTAD